ncbi:MAG: AtpZ/AtpI family protein [Bacteroidia bacterium]|nr:AtpZ/AtpI family protein [Bacteroidia bacterium]
MAVPRKTPPKPDPEDIMREYLRYMTAGFEVIACIMIFAGAGYGLDRWLQTEKPWFLLFLSLLGCAAALYLLIRKLGNPSKP